MQEVKSAVAEAYEQTLDRSLWEHKIKDKCFLCGAKIPCTWNHYSQMGNCCEVCSVWCGMSQRAKDICIVKTLPEWRDLSQKERNKEKARIEEIIKKNKKSYGKENIRKAR